MAATVVARGLVKFLFLLTFALRSLVPAGFMLAPAPETGGKITVVICTGHGPATLNVDPAGAPSKPAKPSVADNGICPFAASCPLVPLCAQSLPASATAQIAPAMLPTVAAVLPVRPELPDPARGPPLSPRVLA